METILAGLVAISLVVGIAAVLAICSGFTLSILWGWFMVPVFHLPELSIPQAIGISVVIHFLTNKDAGRKDDREVSLPQILFYYPGVLLLGWLIHLCM